VRRREVLGFGATPDTPADLQSACWRHWSGNDADQDERCLDDAEVTKPIAAMRLTRLATG
jgi:hypothetical protein